MIAWTLVGIIVAVLLFWKFWFCRKPARTIPKEDVVLSPANGSIAIVKRFNAKEKIKKWNRGSVELLCDDVAEKGWLILIVMTPLHVHFQRAPVAGTVQSITYREGSFRNAMRGAASLGTLENERNEILFRGRHGKMKIAQIAGVLARRISCFVREGEKVKKGQIIGFINLGSQVAVVLPEKAKPRVKVGQSVTDGETVLAQWA